MPIQIIDGFKLGASKPIDDRIVASGSTARFAIPNKYDGLLVVDTKDRKPYIWNADSGTWSSISSGSNGVPGSVTTSTNNTYVGNTDNVYIGGNSTTKNVYIGDTNNKSDLNVSNNLNVTGLISGDGSKIMNINPSNISGGTIDQVLQIKQTNGKLTPTWSTISTGGNTIAIKSTVDSSNYFIGFINSISGSVSDIYNKQGVGIQNNVFYLNGVGLSASVGTITTASITDLNVSRAGTFSRVFSTDLNATNGTFSRAGIVDLNVSRAGTFSRAGIIDLNVSRAGTFSRAGIIDLSVSGTGTFSGITLLNNNAGVNKVLISDSIGKASWGNIPNSSPIGSIIIWAINITIPGDYKICDGIGSIYIGGSYQLVPNLHDRTISGVDNLSSLGTYGFQSPATQSSVTLSVENLPRHYHGIVQSPLTGQSTAAKVTINSISTSTFTDSLGHTHEIPMQTNDGITGNVGVGSGSPWTGTKPRTLNTKVTGSVSTTTTTTIDGYTDNMQRFHGTNLNKPLAMPWLRGYKVLFLIKYNPSALPNTEGHWKTA